MCLICVEFKKGRMTVTEAKRAAGEIIEFSETPRQHEEELFEALEDADFDKIKELLDEVK